MNAAAKFWDVRAKRYAQSPIKDVKAYEYTLSRTASYLSPGDTVLELGCGTGMTALKLAPKAKRIVASDLSQGMLDIGKANAAAQNIENVEFVQGVAATAPAGPFDVAMAFNLLHLVEDLDATIGEVYKRVGPGGLFISKTFCKPHDRISIKLSLMRIVLPVMQFLGKAPFVRLMTIKELESAITSGGFEIIETGNYPANPPCRYLVARRK